MSDQPKSGPGNVAQLPSKGAFRKLKDCRTLAEAFETKEIRDRIAGAIPKHMDPDTMLRAFVMAASKTPHIKDCDMMQSLGAFMSLTYLGLVPGTIQQLAHLIPYERTKWNATTKKREHVAWDLQVQIGYPGYLELALRSGFVKSVHCDVVLPGEHFRAEHGTHKVLEHRPELDRNSSGLMPRAAYAYVRMTHDDDQFEVMPWADVLKIRDRSQAFRSAQAAKERAEKEGWRIPPTWTEAPWVRDEREMGKKTAFRRLAKWLPKCPELRAGVAIEDSQDGGHRLDFGPIIDGTATPFDGIQEVTETTDGGGGGDPGSAFGDRREGPDGPDGPDDQDGGGAGGGTGGGSGGSTRTAGNKTAGTTATATGQTGKPPADRQPGSASTADTSGQTAAHSETTAPGFEAILIDAYGEPADGEIHTDPVKFSRALAELYDATIETERGALLEHNADTIADAREYPGAVVILNAMEDGGGGPASQTGEPAGTTAAAEPIRPVDVRGRPDWKGWTAAIRTAAAGQTTAGFGPWLDVQRETLTSAPMSQRALAARALTEAAGKLNASLPRWFAEAIHPSAKASEEAGGASTETLTQAQRDERGGASQMGELRRIALIDPPAAALAAFEEMAKAGAVQAVMRRLAGDPTTKPLFDRIDRVFLEVRQKIDARIAEQAGGAGEDDAGPPTPDDEDYRRGDGE
jgi:recombination protein RecT